MPIKAENGNVFFGPGGVDAPPEDLGAKNDRLGSSLSRDPDRGRAIRPLELTKVRRILTV